MKKNKVKNWKLKRRHFRVRRKLSGTSERPRLAVHRSLKNILAQVIDDSTGHTLVSASTLQSDVKSQLEGKTGGNVAAAELLGKVIAERAQAKGIKQVAFDRGGFRYHGRIKALADAARKAGLDF